MPQCETPFDSRSDPLRHPETSHLSLWPIRNSVDMLNTTYYNTISVRYAFIESIARSVEMNKTEHLAMAQTEESGHSMAKSHPARNFFIHFLEMLLAMAVGMVVGGVAFWGAVGAKSGINFDQAGLRFPVLLLAVVAICMTVPMVGWMRLRGHGWRISSEMAASMVIPAIPFILLTWFRVITWPACGLYCLLTIPAMLIAMFLRRSEYSQHRHNPASHQHAVA